MNVIEERMQIVGDFYESLTHEQQELVSIYADHIRELIMGFDDPQHIAYMAIALDFVATELHAAIDKAQ